LYADLRGQRLLAEPALAAQPGDASADLVEQGVVAATWHRQLGECRTRAARAMTAIVKVA